MLYLFQQTGPFSCFSVLRYKLSTLGMVKKGAKLSALYPISGCVLSVPFTTGIINVDNLCQVVHDKSLM